MHIALFMHYIPRWRNHMTASKDYLLCRNRRLARQRWGSAINRDLLETLKSFSKEFCFSISSGDLLLLDNSWYVTHVGLIRLARRNRCHGILAEPAQELCDPKEGPVLLATATPIHPMFPRSSAAPRCAWPRPVPSIAPCARPTASASARSRRSERSESG
jgi:hypothetical protein